MKITVKSSTLAITVFFICLVSSWHLLSRVNFFFDTIYDVHQIESHIAEFAPQNRQNRSDFELTSKDERVRIMKRILIAVNSKGAGLENIKYFNLDGAPINNFLTLAEVEHLKDVSILLQLMNRVAIVLLIFLILILLLAKKYRKTIPQLFVLIRSMGCFVFIISGLIFFLGPLVVFNKLHEWIFYGKSQWSFYYQDSLMTTLLKAPETFATMAILMTILALTFWIFTFYITKKLLG